MYVNTITYSYLCRGEVKQSAQLVRVQCKCRVADVCPSFQNLWRCCRGAKISVFLHVGSGDKGRGVEGGKL